MPKKPVSTQGSLSIKSPLRFISQPGQPALQCVRISLNEMETILKNSGFGMKNIWSNFGGGYNKGMRL